MRGRRFWPENYLDASQERLGDAHRLHVDARYSAAIYLSGVAVESVLRAWRTRMDPEFDERHDLIALLKGSGIFEFIKEGERKVLSIALAEVWKRWSNDYRFAGDARLRADYVKRDLLTPKECSSDDPQVLKAHSRSMLGHANEIVSLGVKRWDSRKSLSNS